MIILVVSFKTNHYSQTAGTLHRQLSDILSLKHSSHLTALVACEQCHQKMRLLVTHIYTQLSHLSVQITITFWLGTWHLTDYALDYRIFSLQLRIWLIRTFKSHQILTWYSPNAPRADRMTNKLKEKLTGEAPSTRENEKWETCKSGHMTIFPLAICRRIKTWRN